MGGSPVKFYTIDETLQERLLDRRIRVRVQVSFDFTGTGNFISISESDIISASNMHLCWAFDIYTHKPGDANRVYIEAKQGTVLRTIPLSTATPNKAMNPTPAEIEKFIPRSHNANTPPIADIGTAEKIKSDCITELKVKNNKMNIKSKATATAIDHRALAASRF